MSGIAGIYHFDGRPADPVLVKKMAATLHHRGPDRQAVWCEDNIGFAGLLLRTTPESMHEKLPWYDSEAQVALTADARIDNRKELLALLAGATGDLSTLSDSRLILEAYKKWGIDCLRYLIGDFAVVLWDQRRRKIFAFRDHFGIRPLYYHVTERFFAFASEIRALLVLPEVACEINEERIADFMACQDDGRSTFYRGIFSLRPAHFLLSGSRGIAEKRYWSLQPGPLLRLRNNKEYVEAFTEIFSESVRCRLRSTGPVGSHLSGGLDSSSVSCMARDLLREEKREQLHSFSFFFKDLKSCDERRYIRPVVQQGNILPHYVQADRFPTREEYEDLQDTFEEAVAAFNTFPVWKINREARQSGISVLLDGFDGDSTVSHGTGRLIELARSMRWIKLIREAEGYAGHFFIPRGQLTYYYLRNYSCLSGLFDRAGRIKRTLLNKQEVPSTDGNSLENTILARDFRTRINADERYQHLRNQQFSRKALDEQKWQVRNLTDYGMPRLLGLIDRCAARFSIEKRFPFWDKRLITFCLSLPAEQKLDHGWNRIIMRRAMESRMPQSVCWRGGKTDLTAHADIFGSTLVEIYQLQRKENIAKISGYLDREKVFHLLENPGHNLSGTKAIQRYRTIALMAWYVHMQDKIQIQPGKA